MTDDKTKTDRSCDTIKAGIDAHAAWYYVARQLDGATPRPVQKMDFDALLRSVARICLSRGEFEWENEVRWCACL